LPLKKTGSFSSRAALRYAAMPSLAAASTGLDFAGLSHEATGHFRSRVKKRHGKGAVAIVKTDFDRIPGIVKTRIWQLSALFGKGYNSKRLCKERSRGNVSVF
jgi:hypothetical protein